MSMTVEELQAVPDGESVSCRNRRWVRIGRDEWQWRETVIPTSALVDDLAHVERELPYQRPQLGTPYRKTGDSEWWYVPVEEGREEDGRDEVFRCALINSAGLANAFGDGHFPTSSVRGHELISGLDRLTPGDAILYIGRIMRRQHAAIQQAERLAQELAEARDNVSETTALNNYKDRLRDYLIEYVTDNDLETAYDTHALFDNLGLAPMKEEVEVTVSVVGHTNVRLDSEEGQQWTPEGAECVGVDGFEVDWEMTVTVTKDVPNGQCACGEVEYDDVSAALQEAYVDYDRFNYTCDCSND